MDSLYFSSSTETGYAEGYIEERPREARGIPPSSTHIQTNSSSPEENRSPGYGATGGSGRTGGVWMRWGAYNPNECCLAVLTIQIINDGTGGQWGSYEYTVEVNGEIIASGYVGKHDRSKGWPDLVRMIGEDGGTRNQPS